jgi:flavin reductase (DIM6/NTAB) family NADH-FMN oxidoreductase RutF
VSILISLENVSNTLAKMRASGAFAINVLKVKQQHLALRFARKQQDGHKSFADVALHVGSTGAPLWSEALAGIECRVAMEYPGGDHTLVLGEVVALDCLPDEEDVSPLTFYRGAFSALRAAQPDLRAAVRAETTIPA